MKPNLFKQEAANPSNPKWEQMITRKAPLYRKKQEIRSEFERDYTRILYSKAYKRLKHKTQVFFSPKNDHICTRGEHVSLVDSVSYTIAQYLGLNTTLTKAIATAHDIGHSPFGHQGEKILSGIAKKELHDIFWHEKNGLNLVDHIELLEDINGKKQNLNLTYAVRDGIVSHCGEIDENVLKPRSEYCDLNDYLKPNQYAPFTWEACVVKLADKISYIGRDIADAISLGILDDKLTALYELLQLPKSRKINNSVIISQLIYDVCSHSTPEKGLILSDENLTLLNHIKQFNYTNIYLSKRLLPSNDYFDLVLHQIFNTLYETYDGTNTPIQLTKLANFYPNLVREFTKWIMQYWDLTDRSTTNLENNVIFHMQNKQDYATAILAYISGMTDNYAIEIYNEIIRF